MSLRRPARQLHCIQSPSDSRRRPRGTRLAPLVAGELLSPEVQVMPRGKEMEGDNRQRRAGAREAREEGKLPSEEGTTLGSSKQRTSPPEQMTHQQRVDLMRRAGQKIREQGQTSARPVSRDRDTENE